MSFEVSDEVQRRVGELIAKYPKKQSAVMPILYIVQEHYGSISNEAIDWISSQVDISPVHVMELVTFYTMYRREPLGKYHIQVCRTLSCGLCGAKKLMEYLHKRLGVDPREVTKDGLFSYEHVECLGSCGTAPMAEINDTYFENLTVEKLGELMDRLQKELPDLNYSPTRDKLGDGLSGCPKSEVI
ncbi:MAG: NAD(P)H-dependent oxidoreductase subunit E [Bdellovibrionales bacterium]|nr:NAD(P)H-dependent oxidoreductase subunit E [Bdellovibrionales bacterium]